jgi:hypothetical protein
LRREWSQAGDAIEMRIQMPELTGMSQSHRGDHEVSGGNGRSASREFKPKPGGLGYRLLAQLKPGKRGEILPELGEIGLGFGSLEYFHDNEAGRYAHISGKDGPHSVSHGWRTPEPVVLDPD